MSRPTCAYCGKHYGDRDYVYERTVVEIGKPIPGPRCNLPMISETFMPPLPDKGGPSTQEEAHAFVPMDDLKPAFYMAPYVGRKGRRVQRKFWDGSSYRGRHSPCCSLTCCHKFTRAAYAAGYRITKKGT